MTTVHTGVLRDLGIRVLATDHHARESRYYSDGWTNEWYVATKQGTRTSYASRAQAIADSQYIVDFYARHGVDQTRQLFRFMAGIGFVYVQEIKPSVVLH